MSKEQHQQQYKSKHNFNKSVKIIDLKNKSQQDNNSSKAKYLHQSQKNPSIVRKVSDRTNLIVVANNQDSKLNPIIRESSIKIIIEEEKQIEREEEKQLFSEEDNSPKIEEEKESLINNESNRQEQDSLQSPEKVKKRRLTFETIIQAKRASKKLALYSRQIEQYQKDFLESLLEIPAIIINQKFEMKDYAIVCENYNTYTVFAVTNCKERNPSYEILKGNEYSSKCLNLGLCCKACGGCLGCGGWTKCFCCERPQIIVDKCTVFGKPMRLGYIKQPRTYNNCIKCPTRSFQIFGKKAIKEKKKDAKDNMKLAQQFKNDDNRKDELLYTISGSSCQFGIFCKCYCTGCNPIQFKISEPNWKEKGKKQYDIVKKSPGCLLATYQNMDSLFLQFPEDADEDHRCLLIAAAIAMDFLFFEESQQNKNIDHHDYD